MRVVLGKDIVTTVGSQRAFWARVPLRALSAAIMSSSMFKVPEIVNSMRLLGTVGSFETRLRRH